MRLKLGSQPSVPLSVSCPGISPNKEEEGHEFKEIRRRGDRDVLADFRRLRQCGDRCGVPAGRHRAGRRVPGVRAERRDDGLCHRPYIRLSSQSSRHRGPCRRRPFSGRSGPALCDRAGGRRGCRRGAAVCDRERRCRFRRQQGFCLKRLWRAFAGSIRPARVLPHGSGDDDDVPVHHHGLHPWQGAGGLRAAGHRPRAGDDPSGQHSRHQYVGQSGAQHRSGAVRRRLGADAALAVLAGAIDRRRAGRRDLSLAQRSSRTAWSRARSRRSRRRAISRAEIPA